MPAVGVRCCRGGTSSTDECMAAAANGECQYPLPLFSYLNKKRDSRKGVGLSVTTLLGCARRAQLEQDHPYYITPATMGSRMQGDMWHTAMEQWVDYPGALIEQRFALAIDGEIVTGQSDLVLPDTGLVADYKTTSRPIYCDDDDGWCESRRLKELDDTYTLQVGIYRLLIEDGYVFKTGRPTGVTVKKMIVSYVNPTNGGRTFQVPLADKDYSYQLLRQLLEPVVAARKKKQLPPVLPARVITGKATGRQRVERDYRCKQCELRTTCDSLATMDRGVSPNEPEYWHGETK